jgi:hypothetical protein
MDLANPILSVDNIELSPERISADLRIGDRHERIQLGLEFPDFLEFERMSEVLECNLPARNAVIDLMTRAHRGDHVSLPADLSDIVRQANEPWPIPRPKPLPLDGTPNSVGVTQVERDIPEAGLTTVHLRIADSSAVVVVDLRGGPRSSTRFRFLEGVHPWQVTTAESNAMLTALAGAVQP